MISLPAPPRRYTPNQSHPAVQWLPVWTSPISTVCLNPPLRELLLTLKAQLYFSSTCPCYSSDEWLFPHAPQHSRHSCKMANTACEYVIYQGPQTQYSWHFGVGFLLQGGLEMCRMFSNIYLLNITNTLYLNIDNEQNRPPPGSSDRSLGL